ncbi:hypothetical protein AALP_AA6G356200 [Arabis alpina]|uniref:Uncharacterized protein n=1 Tax=Arabis alpina TaxID=50452 RepID=A0A087GTU1_ARAAL|nr:hypothetical protein AALP_AA6G356200 [Arabis alpina]
MTKRSNTGKVKKLEIEANKKESENTCTVSRGREIASFVKGRIKPSSYGNAPVLSHNKTVVDVSKENETGINVSKETCVASGSGSQNGQVCSIAVEEQLESTKRRNIDELSGSRSQNGQVIQLESTERRNIEEVSAPDRKHIDPKESVTVAAKVKEGCKADIIINRRAGEFQHLLL